MRNSKIIMFILIITSNIVFGQPYYKKFYNTETANGVGGKAVIIMNEITSNEVVFAGAGPKFINVNLSTGDTLNTKKYFTLNNLFVADFLPVYNEYSFFGTDYSIPGNLKCILIICDSAINSLYRKNIDLYQAISKEAMSIKYTFDNEILLGSVFAFNNFPYLYSTLFKTSSNGSLIWHKSFYNSQFILRGINEIISVNDGSIIVCFKSDSLGIVIARLDSTGNPIWCKSWFRPGGTVEKMIQNADGTFMVTGHVNLDTFGSAGPVYLMKLDTAGSIIWCKYYGDNSNFYSRPFTTLISTNDGGYLLSSNFYHSLVTWNDNSADILFLKLDQNGDTLWTRIHGSDVYDAVGEVIQTSDGGYFAAGHTMGRVTNAVGVPFGGFYLIRTDSMGYSGCQEWSFPLPVSTVFPTDSNIVLTVAADSVIQDTAGITQTPLGYFSIFDGCLVTNVSEQPAKARNGMQLYPNPAKGKVTITAPDAPKPQDYITVYDSMGKIVLQRPYKEENQQLDLSRLTSGVYTVKIVQKERVSVGKVVIEQ